MKQLVILRGAMCSGKSTWVRHQGLEDFTVSPDELRVRMGLYTSRNLQGHYVSNVYKEKKLWNVLLDIIEERMSRGQLTVIDATHGTPKAINMYRSLCQKYGYRAYVVDFAMPLDELLKRVAKRNKSVTNLVNNKYIPDSAVKHKYEQLGKSGIPSWVTVTTPEEASTVIPWRIEKTDEDYFFIGDIHSSYKALKELWDTEDLDNYNGKVVLLGDLFDRGIRPVETFKFISQKVQEGKVTMLMGNHDLNLYNLVNNTIIKCPGHTKEDTFYPLLKGGISEKQIRQFLRHMGQGLFIQKAGHTLYATHGGIMPVDMSDPWALSKISTNEMIYGTGKFEEDIDTAFENYVNTTGDKVVSIHGHRNLRHGDTYYHSYNLEQGVDEGGDLSAVEAVGFLGGLFMGPLAVRNHEFNLSVEDKQWAKHQYELSVLNNPKAFLALAKRNKHLLVKPVAPDVYSVNFTPDAFKNGIWDNMTVRSRGLFINDRDNEVYARGYDKFFKVSELGGWDKCGLEGHVDMYKKYNGFLGLLTWDKQKDEPVAMSKSKVADGTSKYADLAKTIIMGQLNNIDKNVLRTFLLNRTALFEVVDELNDPSHIVHNFDKPTAVLLDIVYNDLVFKKVDYESLQKIAKALGIPVKEKLGSADMDYQKQAQEFAKKQHELEGIVIEDESGTMVKAKTNLYNVIKGMRGKWDYSLHHYVATEKLEKSLNECLAYKYDVMGNAKESKRLEQGLVKALISEYYLSKPEKSILNIRKKYSLLGSVNKNELY